MKNKLLFLMRNNESNLPCADMGLVEANTDTDLSAVPLRIIAHIVVEYPSYPE